jgi:uncharacterized membrane protein YcaP (DUF421 family)
MFSIGIPLTEKLLRTVLVYALIAILVRMTGKRGLAGLNTLDIAVVFLLSNVVQNAIIGNDLSVTGGAVGAVTLVVVNSLLNRASVRSAVVARIFDGTDTTVIAGGKIVTRAVRRLGLRRDELDHAVRLQNGDDMGQVESGVLEANGQLLITLRASEQGATKGDVERLAAQLMRIESALTARGAGQGADTGTS